MSAGQARVALVDAGGANLGSVTYALERLGVLPVVVRDADQLVGMDRVILPGVGAAAPAMRLLRERGLVEAMQGLAVPLLGICLGMQLLYEHSEEGDTACLGLLQGRVARLHGLQGIRIPHMGWNDLQPLRPSLLMDDIVDGAQAYFVHGYAAATTDDCIASSCHGQPFAAVVQRGRVCGAQFHPERSGRMGLQFLRNFLALEVA